MTPDDEIRPQDPGADPTTGWEWLDDDSHVAIAWLVLPLICAVLTAVLTALLAWMFPALTLADAFWLTAAALLWVVLIWAGGRLAGAW